MARKRTRHSYRRRFPKRRSPEPPVSEADAAAWAALVSRWNTTTPTTTPTTCDETWGTGGWGTGWGEEGMNWGENTEVWGWGGASSLDHPGGEASASTT
ncbi:hypothetical protein B0H12DRAFT_1235013 [Mycena haematopus]|nr:hypothetical protein B0H12DRAFT_1235013 [Mycena haematopus]